MGHHVCSGQSPLPVISRVNRPTDALGRLHTALRILWVPPMALRQIQMLEVWSSVTQRCRRGVSVLIWSGSIGGITRDQEFSSGS